MDWVLPPPSWSCPACGREIAFHERYHALLTESGASFERRNFCAPCWPSRPGGAVFSHWEGTRMPAGEKRLVVDDETLFDFFRNLAEGGSPQELDLRFVLSLLLVRRRMIKFDRMEERSEGMFLVLRRPKEDGLFFVRDRNLSEAEIGEVKQKIEGFLDVKIE